LWVPEVTIIKITSKAGVGTLSFNLNVAINNQVVNIAFNASRSGWGTGISGTRIINAGYKWFWDNGTPSLSVNQLGGPTVAATPAPPGTPTWSNIYGMYEWMVTNWGAYGSFGYGKDEILLFLNPTYSNGTLAISEV